MVPERIEYTIVQDWKENPRKCTVEPLRATRAIHLYRLREPGARDVPLAVGGGIVLAIDAPVLAPDDRAWLDETRTVIVLDATWKRVGKVRRRVQFTEPERTIERRLPSEIVTAYPRRSKIHEDPAHGLATVEAIFAVSVILGERRLDLLAHYPWREEFLELNRVIFERFE